MQLAVAILPTAPVLPWQTMAELLDEMVPPAGVPASEGDVAFGVSVTSDWQTLIWHVVDDRSRLLSRIGENVQLAGAPASPLLPLIKASIAAGTTRLGCWCRGATSGLTTGWSLPVEIPLEPLSSLIPAHPAGLTIRKWAKRADIQTCQEIEQCYLGAASQLSLQLPLPGAEITTQLAHALELFEQLGIEGIPDAQLAAIAALVPPATQLALYAELSNTGLAEAGIAVPKPPLHLILQLHELRATRSEQDREGDLLRKEYQRDGNRHEKGENERLAAFQGMLGAANIDLLRCVQSARGFHLRYTYFPLGDDI
jgi:hypothetical protein